MGSQGGLSGQGSQDWVPKTVLVGSASLPVRKWGVKEKDGGHGKMGEECADAAQKWVPKREPGLLLMTRAF
jgi:hypothetical protein